MSVGQPLGWTVRAHLRLNFKFVNRRSPKTLFGDKFSISRPRTHRAERPLGLGLPGQAQHRASHCSHKSQNDPEGTARWIHGTAPASVVYPSPALTHHHRRTARHASCFTSDPFFASVAIFDVLLLNLGSANVLLLPGTFNTRVVHHQYTAVQTAPLVNSSNEVLCVVKIFFKCISQLALAMLCSVHAVRSGMSHDSMLHGGKSQHNQHPMFVESTALSTTYVKCMYPVHYVLRGDRDSFVVLIGPQTSSDQPSCGLDQPSPL